MRRIQRVAVMVVTLCLLVPSAQAHGAQGQQSQEQQGQQQEPRRFEEEVVVSASRTEQLLLDAPTAVTLISAALIEASPAANYAEARGAGSHRDFVHKMQICVKELRETSVWLRFASRLGGNGIEMDPIKRECDELIAIFTASINTARGRKKRPQH